MNMELHDDGPVTVVVRHRVKPGCEAEFETWLRGITGDMTRFDGQQGFNVVRSVDGGRPEYLVFFRFDTFDHLNNWETSQCRREWLDRLDPLAVTAPSRERHRGLEVWFTPPVGRRLPARWKMFCVTLLAIYPLISLVQLLLVPMMPSWPVALRTLLTSALLVCLMTYVVMPGMTRLFSPWLYGSSER